MPQSLVENASTFGATASFARVGRRDHGERTFKRDRNNTRSAFLACARASAIGYDASRDTRLGDS